MLAARDRESPAPAGELVELGRVEGSSGRRGVLTVVLYGDDPANLISAEEVTLLGESGAIPFRVRRAEPAGLDREGGARVRLELAGIDSGGDAERWRGAVVAVPASALAELPEGEFYWRELLGTRCMTQLGVCLGVVQEIWPTGANDVLVVHDGQRQLLIPATDEVLVRLDREAGELWVNPPKGLLDPEPE